MLFVDDQQAQSRHDEIGSEMGGVICPPVPAFYQRPDSLSDVVDHSVARVLDLFDIENPTALRRWQGLRVHDPA